MDISGLYCGEMIQPFSRIEDGEEQQYQSKTRVMALNLPLTNPPPRNSRPYDQGLLTIGFPE